MVVNVNFGRIGTEEGVTTDKGDNMKEVETIELRSKKLDRIGN